MSYSITTLKQIGLSAIAVSTVYLGATAPAQAGTFTFNYDATVNADAELTDFAGFLASLFLEDELPDDLGLEIEETFSGSFTTEDDIGQYLADGKVTLGPTFLADTLGLSSEDLGLLGELDDLFDLDLVGTGTLNTTFANNSLVFDYFYDSVANSLEFNFAPNQVSSVFSDCLIGLCTVESIFEFDLFGTPELLALLLDFPSPNEVSTSTLIAPPIFNPPLVTGGGSTVAMITPATTESVPEPSVILGLLAGGGLLAASRRKSAV